MHMIDEQEILETLEELQTPQERYQFLIEVGDELPPLDEQYRTEMHRVQGCTSNVWLVLRPGSEPGTIAFEADSDSHIVRGLVVLLLTLYSGKTPEEILNLDVDAIFERIGLHQQLSRSRSNGLRSMVKRIRDLAQLTRDAAAQK